MQTTIYATKFFLYNHKNPRETFALLAYIAIATLSILTGSHISGEYYLFYFELLFLALSMTAIYSATPISAFLFIIFTTYTALSLVYTELFNDTNIRDFLLSYKAFLYAALLSLFINKNYFSPSFALRIFDFLLAVFLIKYTSEHLIGNTIRPTVFVENNFELMMLLMMLIWRTHLTNRIDLLRLFILSIIIILSGSRSAALALLAVTLILNLKSLSLFRAFTSILALAVISPFVYLIFAQRGGGTIDLESIDRFNFLMVFLSETKEWPAWMFLTGTERISPLSTHACSELSYYVNLFSYSGDGSCYSVIFHSYILRVTYDHGIIIFLLMITFVYYATRKSRYTRIHSAAIISLILINGLSVSSFNSVFYALTLAMMISTIKPFLPVQGKSQ